MTKPLSSAVVGIGPAWLHRRQLGMKNPLGTRCHIYEQIYSNILPCGCWDHTVSNPYVNVHGGVFGLEFSPEGSLLVAACEKRSVLMFDPLTQKRIHTVKNAHMDCVNCVKFLDSRSFATCSDDYTVALWDARNLSQKVRSLKGHSNWVKNIEYSPKDGLLVTSGFDGSVLTWEMNKYREDGNDYNRVFSTNGLMRTRLTPDSTKMIVCTTRGYLILIHNLDLSTLRQDLDGFRPNMYHLMQLNQTILPIESDFTHLFHGQGKRNRVEFVTDFPKGDDAEVVASLLIHPEGHSAISRNVTNNESSEWSCIHNIEERWSSDESDCTDDEAEDTENCKTVGWSANSTSVSTTPSYIIQHSVVQGDRRGLRAENAQGANGEQSDMSPSPCDVWEALVAIQEARIRRETDRLTSELYVGQLFRRHAHDVETQVRGSNAEGQIFVTRIFPGSSNESRPRTFVSSAPVSRRNVSVNTTPAAETNGVQRPSFRGPSAYRKKLPVRLRYASLYRRSLVGQYDRTSIFRKPIYNYRTNYLNIRKLRNKLIRRSRLTEPQNEAPTEETTSAQSPEVTSSSVNAAINSLSQDLSSLENNLNSFRESISNLEGTINSTCNVLRREQSILQTINNLIGKRNGDGGEHSGSSASSNGGDQTERIEEASRGSSPPPSESETSAASAAAPSASTRISNRRPHLDNTRGCNSQEESKKRSQTRRTVPVNKKIYQNTKRLTHYVEEPNLGRGFIKELCVSPDGRIICSPYGNGIRLLSFSPTVQDIFHCYPRSPPVPLHELTLNVAHADIVVSTKFSPHHNLLVSGCLSGKIVYYQPFL